MNAAAKILTPRAEALAQGRVGVPLVVDLDRTLTPADVTVETMVAYSRTSVIAFFKVLLWVVSGRAVLKAMLARVRPVDASVLPIREEVMELVHRARADGREVILASASHQRNVTRVAKELGVFDRCLASRRHRNLKGRAKLRAIAQMIGDGEFDYIGDSKADLPLWAAARNAYTVRHASPAQEVERICSRPSAWRALLKGMRLHQWAKNALIFVPVLTAGLILDPSSVTRASLAALLFSLVASGVYLANDVLDVNMDRAHPTKRFRPIACGNLSVGAALVASLILTIIPVAIAIASLGIAFGCVILTYLVLTTAYSLRLKAVMALDTVVLASLYTIRIVAGAIAVSVQLSFWLITFSIFFFLSLAYVKRYTELAATARPAVELLPGRGYTRGDLQIVAMAGVSAGFVSILVLALYIQAVSESASFATPQLLWLNCLILLYWINRIWMMAGRGGVDGDPVAFAMRDRRSLAIASVMAAVFVAAQRVDLPTLDDWLL